ncbi:hypothetical protein D3C71_1529490 [compost metagenome]
MIIQIDSQLLAKQTLCYFREFIFIFNLDADFDLIQVVAADGSGILDEIAADQFDLAISAFRIAFCGTAEREHRGVLHLLSYLSFVGDTCDFQTDPIRTFGRNLGFARSKHVGTFLKGCSGLQQRSTGQLLALLGRRSLIQNFKAAFQIKTKPHFVQKTGRRYRHNSRQDQHGDDEAQKSFHALASSPFFNSIFLL